MLYAVKRIDGGLEIIRTVQQPDGSWPLPEEITKKRQELEGAVWTEIKDSDLPAERDFRDAWDLVGKKVKENMPKAREIHMAKIRKARNAKLDLLDKEVNRARDQKNVTQEIELVALKQTLRDIPQTIDLESAKTAAQLRAKWPADLEKPKQ